MKKIFLAILFCMGMMTQGFAFDKATEGTTYYGSNCAAYGLADGTVAIYNYYAADNQTEVIFPSTIQVFDGETMTAEYEVSAVGVSGWNNVYFGNASTYQYAGNITSLVFSEGIKKINASAFFEMTSLKNVTLPSTMTTIGDYAFNSCDAMEKMVIEAKSLSLGNEALKGKSDWDAIAKGCKVVVPDGCLPNYAAYSFDDTKTWTYWDQFYANGNLVETSSESGGTSGISTTLKDEETTSQEAFNLQGMMVDKGYHGLIIKKGKKYFNK